MIVSKTAKGGPEKDDKWCYECPEDGKCPGTIKLIEWEGKKMDVEFKKDTDVCIDDCGYQILRIYAASNQSVNIDSSLEMRDSAMSGDTQSSSFQNN